MRKEKTNVMKLKKNREIIKIVIWITNNIYYKKGYSYRYMLIDYKNKNRVYEDMRSDRLVRVLNRLYDRGFVDISK